MQNGWEKIGPKPVWNFQEENELIGYYMKVETEVGPNKSKIYVFRKEDGSLIGVWGSKVLDEKFKDLVCGEEIRIVYKGKARSPKTGRQYHDFDVYRRKPDLSKIKNEETASIENN